MQHMGQLTITFTIDSDTPHPGHVTNALQRYIIQKWHAAATV